MHRIEQVLSENLRSRPEAVYKYSERKRSEIVNKKSNRNGRKTEFFNTNIYSNLFKEK